MVFKWKGCSHISASAQAAGEQCTELEREGNLTAKALVDANRAEDAPLHAAFEWRDDVAAEKYRENQARHIINCLVTVPEGGSVEPVRVFLNIKREEPRYMALSTILTSEEDTLTMLKTATRELRAFEQKYKFLKELAGVFYEIDKL